MQIRCDSIKIIFVGIIEDIECCGRSVYALVFGRVTNDSDKDRFAEIKLKIYLAPNLSLYVDNTV